MSYRFARASWRAVAVLGAALLLVCAATTPGHATRSDRRIVHWIERTATPIDTVDPGAGLDDLAHLSPAVANASVVGLGEQVHGAKELLQLKLRTLRLLVEEHGFRSVAWEDDWTLGLEVDRWIKTGEGDLGSLIREMSTAHRNREVEGTLRWLRDYNRAHPADPVTFVGVEYWTTRESAYDAVKAYIAERAPDHLAEAGVHLAFLRPRAEINEWKTEYGLMDADDKAPFLRHARQLRRLVRDLPHGAGDRDHSLAAHHARQILNFYEHYAVWPNHAYRDEHAAQNLRWWQRHSGDKVAYWAANAHTARAPEIDFYVDGQVAASWAGVGSFMDTWYGPEYVSIGFTFGHGSYYDARVWNLPPAAETWFEHMFAEASAEQLSLDLAARAPRAVQRWLNAPARTRGLPEYGLASHMQGGTVAQWFDVVVYRHAVTAAAPAAAPVGTPETPQTR